MIGACESHPQLHTYLYVYNVYTIYSPLIYPTRDKNNVDIYTSEYYRVNSRVRKEDIVLTLKLIVVNSRINKPDSGCIHISSVTLKVIMGVDNDPT
jgi:hypothetical protein